ncbi:hypothetical protein ACSNOI_24305 [Actinomadura kijaniata]|uniref:hypothetical protein n=1 Tax=Actinomadura kijaniata TaxID=46161 RepID=UPI003F1A2B0A
MKLRQTLGALAVAVSAATALPVAATPATASSWQLVARYADRDECEYRALYYIDGSTGHECRWNAYDVWWELWIGP